MSQLQDAIREAAWCQCTQFTAEYEEALRLAARLEEIVREIVRANETDNGAIGLVEARLGSDHAVMLRQILEDA